MKPNDFYVGQEVICVDSSGTSGLERNKEYVIEGIKKDCCSNNFLLDVNVNTKNTYTECSRCRTILSVPPTNNVFISTRFKPKDEQTEKKSEFKEITFTEIKKQVPTLSEN